MVKCPWCNEWEGPQSQYSDHLKYCKKYPPNIEAMKEQARVCPIGESEISERTQLINRLREAVSKLPAFHIEWSGVEQMSTSELREVVEDIEEQLTKGKKEMLPVREEETGRVSFIPVTRKATFEELHYDTVLDAMNVAYNTFVESPPKVLHKENVAKFIEFSRHLFEAQKLHGVDIGKFRQQFEDHLNYYLKFVKGLE